LLVLLLLGLGGDICFLYFQICFLDFEICFLS
jgi:hypothetical protein